MIVQSTTLDTEAKVKAIYGGSKWTMISGRFLLGAAAGEAGQTGGAEKHKPRYAYWVLIRILSTVIAGQTVSLHSGVRLQPAFESRPT